MTSVYVALISAFGGALAGFVPTLLVSRPRKLLRLLAEEAEALGKVSTGPARSHLLKAQRSTAKAYHDAVTRDPLDVARGRVFKSVFVGYPVAFVSLLLSWKPEQVAESERTQDIVRLVSTSASGVVLVLVAFFAFSFLTTSRQQRRLRLSQERVRSSQERERRLAEAQKALEDAVNSYQRTASERAARLTGPQDRALRDLQASVKEAREERERLEKLLSDRETEARMRRMDTLRGKFVEDETRRHDDQRRRIEEEPLTSDEVSARARRFMRNHAAHQDPNEPVK